MFDRKTHWDKVYSTVDETGVSWYQSAPRLSLDLIRSVAPEDGGRIIDIGGGTSLLVDWLLDLPFEKIAVLDVSETALSKARARLGERAALVDWIAADITDAPTFDKFDVWHDRAVFHFLTDAEDRRRYVELAGRTVRSGGHLMIASFADDGPRRCSGLDVCRYDAESMATELGDVFSLVRQAREVHTTPSGCSQVFFYGVFRRQ